MKTCTNKRSNRNATGSLGSHLLENAISRRPLTFQRLFLARSMHTRLARLFPTHATAQYRLPSRNTSPYSSNGLRISFWSFHKLGVRKPYELPTATNVAFRVFSNVFVLPAEDVYASWTPASCNSLLTAGEATKPVPRGAGMSRTVTEPHLPDSFVGRECGSPRLVPQ